MKLCVVQVDLEKAAGSETVQSTVIPGAVSSSGVEAVLAVSPRSKSAGDGMGVRATPSRTLSTNEHEFVNRSCELLSARKWRYFGGLYDRI
jgi:hypothetical protein